MEPIISPWIIYGVSVLTKLGVAIHVLLFLSIAALLLTLPAMETKGIEKLQKRFVISIFVFGFLDILMPDKDTLLTMLALQYVTPDNIQSVQSNVVDFVSQIAQAVKDVK